LFYAEVDESSRVNDGGGVAHEDEDIEIVPVPRGEAMRWLATHDIGDAKTIIALQWADARVQEG
jgi:hypothetical protein